MTHRVGNDPNREAFRKKFRNSKADSVDRDRTLESHVMRKFFRHFDFQSEICALPVERDNARDAIDVALNEVSAEACVSARSPLQI